MTWGYRLSVQRIDGREHWSIREVYYRDSGEVESWTEPIHRHGDTRDDLIDDLRAMVDALSKPAFDVDAETWLD